MLLLSFVVILFGFAQGLTRLQCVFDVDFTQGLTLIELADGVTVDEVRSKTGATFKEAAEIKPML